MRDLHEAYINHVMACAQCYAPTARYCPAGEGLRADYLTDYIMGQPDRLVRRTLMQAEKQHNPHLFPLLNQKVREKLGEQADG